MMRTRRGGRGVPIPDKVKLSEITRPVKNTRTCLHLDSFYFSKKSKKKKIILYATNVPISAVR